LEIWQEARIARDQFESAANDVFEPQRTGIAGTDDFA
jgi:hypothetical protein